MSQAAATNHAVSEDEDWQHLTAKLDKCCELNRAGPVEVTAIQWEEGAFAAGDRSIFDSWRQAIQKAFGAPANS